MFHHQKLSNVIEDHPNYPRSEARLGETVKSLRKKNERRGAFDQFSNLMFVHGLWKFPTWQSPAL